MNKRLDAMYGKCLEEGKVGVSVHGLRGLISLS